MNGGPILSSATPVFPLPINISVPGPYLICHWIASANCQSDTTCQTANSVSTPVVSINPVDDQCLTGNSFDFALQGDAFDSVAWSFGLDALPSFSNDSMPAGIVFQNPGFKIISVVTAIGGCQSDTALATFAVNEVIAGVIAPNQACEGEIVTFQDISLGIPGGLVSWAWIFSDGQSFTGQTIDRSFSPPGLYSFVLTATDGLGCTDSSSGTIFIDSALVPVFSDSVAGCYEVHFSNQSSTGPGGIYQWDFGDGNSSTQYEPVHTYSSLGTYQVTLNVFGLCGPVSYGDSLILGPACVWPGDANNDGIANNVDVLSIGLAYGQNGPLRPNASLSWEDQPTGSWNGSLPGSGINYAYTDTDGNAIVNDDDTLAVSLNYGLTHNKGNTSQVSGPILYFDTLSLSGPVQVGSAMQLPIILGTPTQMVDSIYAIAFTINYQSHLIDTSTMGVAPALGGSWFGNNLLRLSKDFYEDGNIDAALSRKNQQNTSGMGPVASCSFVMIDDIAKRPISDTLILSFSDIHAITASGAEVLIGSIPARIVVVQDKVSSANDPQQLSGIELFPNPSSGNSWLRSTHHPIQQVRITNAQGQELWKTQANGLQVEIPSAGWPAGIYLLHLQSQAGSWAQKLVLSE